MPIGNIPQAGFEAEQRAKLEKRFKKLEARLRAAEDKLEALAAPVVDKAALLAEAKELGIECDARWGAEKLATAIAGKRAEA
jgi:hypothetical protein